MNRYTAITIGDEKGIGIEILFNLLEKKNIKNSILFCNHSILKKIIKLKKIKIDVNIVNKNKNKIEFKKNKLNIFNYNCRSSYENTYKSLIHSFNFCKSKLGKGIVTLPLNKEKIKNNIDKNFIGHTEFFQKKDRKQNSNMILYHNKIIISTLTTHIKLKDVSRKISKKDFLKNQIINLNNSLIKDFNIKNPKIIISGLNPHAGENGKIGIEEKKIIIPILKIIKKMNISIDGPFSADSILIDKNLDKYHCFLFIYHDQALIPFKYISKFSGVNYTGNLSIIRTSPDHGTAYNLVGTKKFSNKSLINCFDLVNKIFANRNKNDT